MGKRNFLIDGGSGTGKTAVCDELARRGYHAIHGDRELAYQGDPVTGMPMEGVTGLSVHDHHLWSAEQVRTLIADRRTDVTFFCGSSRNITSFIDVFDGVFALTVDTETLAGRLDERPGDEWGGRGRHAEQEFIMRLNTSQEDIPKGHVAIDATAPLNAVVDHILARTDP